MKYQDRSEKTYDDEDNHNNNFSDAKQMAVIDSDLNWMVVLTCICLVGLRCPTVNISFIAEVLRVSYLILTIWDVS